MQLVLAQKILPEPETGDGGAVRHREKQKIKKKYILLLALGLLLLASAALGVKALFFSAEAQTALTETTTYGSLSTTIEGTGTTMAANSVTVTTASTARIEKVYVAAGDTVAVGDALYTQDDSALDDQVEEYQDQISELQDEVDSSNEQITALRETMENLVVTAPFTGRITEINVEEGAEAMAGSKLAVLVDDNTMTLTQYFSYAYATQVYVGMSAGISVASLRTNLVGTVTDIEMVERMTTEGTRCFAVTVSVVNPGALTEGMTGAGYLTADSGEKLYPAIEGTLECQSSKTMTAKASGEITAINAVAYQTVTAGDTLFQIDGESYQTQIDSLTKKITQAQARIAAYNDKIAESEEARADYTVVSALAGKVIMVGVREGETPRQAGAVAVSVYNMDAMTVTANIDELDIDSIQMGMSVDITRSGAEADETYTGTITEVSYEATNTNGVAYFPVTIEIPADGALSAGVNVSYSITVGDASEGVLVPISALKNTSEGVCLFVKADARPENAVDLEDGAVPDGFYAVPIETGVSNSRFIRVLSGAEQDVDVFARYQQSAPSGGDSTSEGQGSEDQSDASSGMNGMSEFGGFPGGGGGGGGMPGGPMG